MDWDGLAATYRQVVFLLLFFFGLDENIKNSISESPLC